MNLNTKELFLISRPRFWMYVLGTFLIGMIAGGNPFQFDESTVFILIAFAIFFILPANLFIYGVNDIYDYHTDILNDKKVKYEGVLDLKKHKSLWQIIGVLLVPFFGLFFVVEFHIALALLVFLFTGFFYSAGPIRAKSKPPLDILFSSVIYVSPSVIGYFSTGNTSVAWLAVLGGLIWASAMQTFSAVPDIKADAEAGIQTLATKLGKKYALIFCFMAYSVSAIIGFYYVGYLALIFGVIYGAIILLSLVNSKEIFKYYTYFPVINVLAGAFLFFYMFFKVIYEN